MSKSRARRKSAPEGALSQVEEQFVLLNRNLGRVYPYLPLEVKQKLFFLLFPKKRRESGIVLQELARIVEDNLYRIKDSARAHVLDQPTLPS